MTYAEKKQKMRDLQRLIENNPDMADSLKTALAELEKMPAEDILQIEHKYAGGIVVDRDSHGAVTFVTEKSLPARAKTLAARVDEFNQLMGVFEHHEEYELSVDDLRTMVSILDTMLSISEMRSLMKKEKKEDK